jgi:hypothetical protein
VLARLLAALPVGAVYRASGRVLDLLLGREDEPPTIPNPLSYGYDVPAYGEPREDT